MEPSWDGVGDYSRQLAGELLRHGHGVTVVALHDPFVSSPANEEQEIGRETVPVLRLPSKLDWVQRVEVARSYLDEFRPDWASLQFVCYGFHPKGLVYGLAGHLSRLLAGLKIHVMFHETWLCKELGWPWKQCLVGFMQRHFIRRFLRATKPKVVHTSNATYASLLSQIGIQAEELELFGNVPVLGSPKPDWIESQLRAAIGNGYRREDYWIFGFFGALHPQWPPEPLLTRLRQAADDAAKRPTLFSIGRIGEKGLELWNRLAQVYADRFAFLRLGEQPADRISEYLSWLDFGIATTPRSILGKSGTVVSMLEHGLPVIVNRDDASSMQCVPRERDPLLLPCDANLETRLRIVVKKGPCGSRLPAVAKAFASALERAAPPIPRWK